MSNSLQFDCRYEYPSGFRLDTQFTLEGQIVGLCGPSGCGKTTVLHLIAGLLTPIDGIIVGHNRTLYCSRQAKNLSAEQRQIGVSFQTPRLFPHLSVRANIEYGYRRNPDHHSIDLQDLISALGLNDVMDRRPLNLSGGEQHRVALARAIGMSPQLLLLDEPFQAVEKSLRRSIADLVQKVAENWRIPTLIVSHDEVLIHEITSSVAHLNNRA